MKVKLNVDRIVENLPSEEQLLDYATIESIYCIRKLKAAIKSLDQGFIAVGDEVSNGQVKSNRFEIWFQEDEYELV